MRPAAAVTVALLFAVLFGACTRCGLVRDRYDAAIRQELARAGAGGAPDTGLHDHVRLVVSEAALQTLASPLLQGDWLRPTVGQRLVGSRRDAVLEVELVPRVTAVAAAAMPTGVGAELTIELVAHARLDAANERQRYTTASTAQVSARLGLQQDDGPVLVLTAMEPTVGEPEFVFGGLPESVQDEAARLGRELLGEAVREAANVLPLVRWSPLDIGGRTVLLTASSLTASDDGALHIGFVTPMRPRGPLLPAGSGPMQDAYWLVHADLPRAVVEHLAVSGALPERFDELGRADIVGDWAATSSSVRIGDDGASHAFRWWCLEGRRCSVDRVRVHYGIEITDGAPELTVGEVTASAGTGRFRTWTEAVRLATEGALTPAVVRAGTRERLEPQVLSWTALPAALRFVVELD